MSLFLTSFKIRVLSGFITNLSAVWFLGIFVSKSFFALTTNLLAFIVSLLLAFKLEELTEQFYDKS